MKIDELPEDHLAAAKALLDRWEPMEPDAAREDMRVLIESTRGDAAKVERMRTINQMLVVGEETGNRWKAVVERIRAKVEPTEATEKSE